MSTATDSKAARRSAAEERRRSKRLPLNIPVKVYGRTPQNQPFRHVTVTSEVSAHGGQLPIDANIQHGQTLLLVNSYTGEERECMVVYVDGNKSRRPKAIFGTCLCPLAAPDSAKFKLTSPRGFLLFAARFASRC
jgi:hypothetical protein